VLNLDTDQVVSLVGGWRDNFIATLKRSPANSQQHGWYPPSALATMS
jgi:hypothetical protein